MSQHKRRITSTPTLHVRTLSTTTLEVLTYSLRVIHEARNEAINRGTLARIVRNSMHHRTRGVVAVVSMHLTPGSSNGAFTTFACCESPTVPKPDFTYWDGVSGGWARSRVEPKSTETIHGKPFSVPCLIVARDFGGHSAEGRL